MLCPTYSPFISAVAAKKVSLRLARDEHRRAELQRLSRRGPWGCARELVDVVRRRLEHFVLGLVMRRHHGGSHAQRERCERCGQVLGVDRGELAQGYLHRGDA
jgi:hypothetical protein